MLVKAKDGAIFQIPDRDYSSLSKLFFELGRDFHDKDPVNLDLDGKEIELFLNFCDALKSNDLNISGYFLREISEIKSELFSQNPTLEKFYELEMESQERVIRLINIADYLICSPLDDLINLKVLEVIYSKRPDEFFKLEGLHEPLDKKELRSKYMQYCNVDAIDETKIDALIRKFQ